jgi:release factor glutamine methyltransferase
MPDEQGRLNVGDLLRWARTRLENDPAGSRRLEIDRLLAHVLDLRPHDLYLDPAREVSDDEAGRFQSLWFTRLRGAPLQHLLGQVEFMSLPFRVAPGVFIPRPETECLLERVIERVPAGPSRWVDVGTGAGVVAVSLAFHCPGSQVIAVDTSPAALHLARNNAVNNGVGERVCFVRGDSLETLQASHWADGVVCNTPYVSSAEMKELPAEVRDYDPVSALHGGPDGLDLVRRLIDTSPAILAPGGMLALEIGEGQGEAVLSMFRHSSLWDRASVHQDLAGRDRVVLAMRPE